MNETDEKRKRSPILALLMVFLIIGGVYTQRDKVLPYIIKIPGADIVTDMLGMGMNVQDEDRISAIEEKIDYKFVENSHSGNLFVITGEIINKSSVPHEAIRVTGRIISTNREIAEEETVFCGNLLPDSELSELNLDDIKNRLNNPSGGNTKVNPGSKLPFMIVFPSRSDMGEYIIEVEGSSPVQG
ncbi:MAG: DUF3426 domain-containing protein [Desulfobacterales bacterium]|nr:DUF3426 domain-containing protein [Desulfobacterales bacterium]